MSRLARGGQVRYRAVALMFGIGIPEIILIALVALLGVGPKNLPVTLRALGRGVREFRKASLELRREAGVDDVVDEVTRPLREGLSGIEQDVMRDPPPKAKALSADTSMEYPEGGPDDYGALPENAMYYPEDATDEPDPATAATAAPTPEATRDG